MGEFPSYDTLKRIHVFARPTPDSRDPQLTIHEVRYLHALCNPLPTPKKSKAVKTLSEFKVVTVIHRDTNGKKYIFIGIRRRNGTIPLHPQVRRLFTCFFKNTEKVKLISKRFQKLGAEVVDETNIALGTSVDSPEGLRKLNAAIAVINEFFPEAAANLRREIFKDPATGRMTYIGNNHSSIDPT